MSSPETTERRISRLENDASAIYGMVGDIQRTQRRHGATLELLSATQAEHTDTLAEHSAALSAHTETLAGHTVILAEHTATLDAHTATLAEHGATLAEHGGKLDRIISLLERRA